MPGDRLRAPQWHHCGALRAASSGALCAHRTASSATEEAAIPATAGKQKEGGMKKEHEHDLPGGSASRPPGFIAYGQEWPLPTIGKGVALGHSHHSRTWVDARVASLRSPTLRPGALHFSSRMEPDNSLANKSGHLDVLTTSSVLPPYSESTR